MDRRYLLMAQACFILATAVSLEAETASKPAETKLHPLLSSVMSRHVSVFNGDPIFEANGANAEEIGVFIYTTDVPVLRRAGIRVQSEYDDFVTARIRVADLATLANLPGVQWVDPGSVCTPATDVSVPMSGAPLLHGGFFNNTRATGKGAIVCVYDSGIDFMHLDFRDSNDTTKSRIIAIWDQTLSKNAAEKNPDGFTYGVEYMKAQIEAEFGSSAPVFVRHRDADGHGTHVAGTAAGNGLAAGGTYKGMAPEADILVIKMGGMTGMVDGLRYAEAVAAKMGKPVSVNWSIGSGGPANGTNPEEVAVDEFVRKPGRAVSVAAGNGGTTRFHKAGSITAFGSDTITILVPPYTPATGNDNDVVSVSMYTPYVSATPLSATVISPRGIVIASPATTSPDSIDGAISFYASKSINPEYHQVYMSVKDVNGKTPAPGIWKIVVKNPTSAALHTDTWVSSSLGGKRVTFEGSDNLMSIGPPATARGAITVGAYITKWDWPTIAGQFVPLAVEEPVGDITTYTSLGPTTDGRQKPDICAPGSNICAAMSAVSKRVGNPTYIAPGNKHFVAGGTSMSSPHVAGACALLLAADPSLTGEAVKSLLQSSALTDAYTASRSSYFWGSGKLDVARAMALLVSPSSRFSRALIAYDSAGASTATVVTNGMQAALRLSPPVSGTLTQAVVRTAPMASGGITGTGDIVCRLYSNAAGLPGTPIGGEARIALSSLNPGTYNYVSLVGAGMLVENAKEYFLVISPSVPGDTLTIEADMHPNTNRSLTYRDGAWNDAGKNYRIRAEVSSLQSSTSVTADNTIPAVFELKQNYPNPFNPSTTISFSLPARARVKLAVYDVLGKIVSTLIDGEENSGAHRAVWNGCTSLGLPAASGVYVYRLESNGTTHARTMLLMK